MLSSMMGGGGSVCEWKVVPVILFIFSMEVDYYSRPQTSQYMMKYARQNVYLFYSCWCWFSILYWKLIPDILYKWR